MSSKKAKQATPTEKLLADMKRVGLDPIEVIHRAIILAEIDGNYKEMIAGGLGVLPYIAPRLKETQMTAEVETTMNGMNGVALNISIGGVPLNPVEAEINEEEENEEEEE